MTETGFMNQPINKYNSKELADRLWPFYLETNGNAAEVKRRADAEGIEISKPTLDKLIDYFGFKEKLETAHKNSFSAAIDHTGELSSMLAEVTKTKKHILDDLENSPHDLQLHRIYGDYLGRQLDIRRQMIAAHQVDRDQLLIDAIKEIVLWLSENGKQEIAQLIGDQLPVIADRIKEKWKQKN